LAQVENQAQHAGVLTHANITDQPLAGWEPEWIRMRPPQVHDKAVWITHREKSVMDRLRQPDADFCDMETRFHVNSTKPDPAPNRMPSQRDHEQNPDSFAHELKTRA
jgi:hypothetical protein